MLQKQEIREKQKMKQSFNKKKQKYIKKNRPNYTESDSKFGNLAKPAPQFFAGRSRPCEEHMVDADE